MDTRHAADDKKNQQKPSGAPSPQPAPTAPAGQPGAAAPGKKKLLVLTVLEKKIAP